MTRVIAVLTALVALGAAAAWWHLRPHRTNVILITIDTMRPDRISAYGYHKHQTPVLDRLAAEGTLFENAFCDVTWTTPSMASVMTGTYATRHGFRSSFQTLKSDAATMAEILRDHGMHTAAIIASYPLHSIFGLNQGFDLYDETFNSPLSFQEDVQFGPVQAPPPVETPPSDDTQAMRWFLWEKSQRDAYRSDPDVSDRAIAWLRAERADPFFLWIHYFGPHEKPTGLVGDENLAAERDLQLAAYDPDVVAVDGEIGRVLAALKSLGIDEDTAIVVHADHGQSLMEHDYFGHGRNVLDPTARIPLIVHAPGRVPAGRRDATLARNVDILPTLLELLGIPRPPGLDGRDLFGAVGSADPTAYIETYLSATWLFADEKADHRIGFRRLGLRTARWKYVINDPVPFVDRPSPPIDADTRRRFYFEELFDLAADPGETRNVIAEHHDVASTMRNEIMRLHRTATTGTEVMPLDDETREKLKALGYLAE